MSTSQAVPALSQSDLRDAVKSEYAEVARNPEKGFHFHTGRDAAERLMYSPEMYARLPEGSIASFAGTGNPFLGGELNMGETVIDAGSGSGFDALIAATMVGEEGQVTGVDMTPEMLAKATAGAEEMGAGHVEFVNGLIEELPFTDNHADVLISNGVLNLTLDKVATLREWLRVLKPGGRLQFGDILVARKIPDSALDDISLWTG
ncbi:MAG: methyltransferase domain-containing protein [Candidatus Marinimicrobia bacterium]|nr:methyltransferase domain-containing protein [Candidatus Neomarinimicrobiota bacterium]